MLAKAGACALDFDRGQPRAGCHFLLVATLDFCRLMGACFLVLEKQADGTFRRIGLSTVSLPSSEREGWRKNVLEGLTMQQLTIE